MTLLFPLNPDFEAPEPDWEDEFDEIEREEDDEDEEECGFSFRMML